MSSRSILAGLSFVLVAIPVWSEPGSLSGFETAQVFDPLTRSIRRVVGVPGGAHLAGTAALELDYASISPSGAWAILRRGSDWSLQRLDAEFSQELRLTEAAESTKAAEWKAVWSASSSSTALFASHAGLVRLCKLDHDVLSCGPVAALPGGGLNIESVAVSDKGYALISASGAEQAGLYRVAGGGEPELLLRIAKPGPVAIGSGELGLFIDREAGVLLQVDPEEGPVSLAILAAHAAFQAAEAMSFSPNDKRVSVITPLTKQLWVFSLSGGGVAAQVDLDFTPEHIERVGTGSQYILTHRKEAGPVWIFDADSFEVRFVPGGNL